jgi:hypothetical protein
MSVDEALEPNLKILNTSLRQIPSFYSFGTGDVPVWYGRLLSNVLLLAGEAPIQYVSGSLNRQECSATVAVFTEELLIRTDIEDWNVDADSHAARALPRRFLSRLEVESGEGVFSQSAFSNWPNSIRLSLYYDGDIEPLRVPLEAPMNGDQLGPLRGLLGTLLVDLKAIA